MKYRIEVTIKCAYEIDTKAQAEAYGGTSDIDEMLEIDKTNAAEDLGGVLMYAEVLDTTFTAVPL